MKEKHQAKVASFSEHCARYLRRERKRDRDTEDAGMNRDRVEQLGGHGWREGGRGGAQ